MNIPTPIMRRGNRTITMNFPTGKTDDEGKEIVAQVFCSHDSNRKVFRASLKPVTVSTDNGFRVESFMVFSGLTLGTQPVARYSANKFELFAQAVRDDVLPRVVAENPKAAAIMAGEGE